MNKAEIPSDRGSKPEDSAPSLPQRDSFEELVVSGRMKTPVFIKGGIVMGILAGTALGGTYLLNRAYNDDAVAHFLPEGGIQYRQADGVYAHTVFTKNSLHYGKDSVMVERHFWNRSKTYIGYHGCSAVDEIIVQEGNFGTGNSSRYERRKDGELKIFDQADRELKEQCERFKSIMKPYLP